MEPRNHNLILKHLVDMQSRNQKCNKDSKGKGSPKTTQVSGSALLLLFFLSIL